MTALLVIGSSGWFGDGFIPSYSPRNSVGTIPNQPVPDGLPQNTPITRKTSTSICVICGQGLWLLAWRAHVPPNDKTHRRRADGANIETAAQSRRSVQ
jgi:hypothetical protein